MGEQPSWKQQLSFSDRFQVIGRLATKLRDSPCHDASSAQNTAQALEKQVYNSATDLEAYQYRCDQLVEEISPGSPRTDRNGSSSDGFEDGTPSDGTKTKIGQYTNAEHHRDGLFSSVFKASHPQPQNGLQNVALKITTPSMMVEPHDSAREARILKGLKHEHILPLLDLFQQAGGRLVLVFPFLPYDLQSMLDQGLVDFRQAQSHLRDMFSGLAFIHQARVIHRDVKPSNILLRTPDGPAYLADFGIAWSPNDASSEPSESKTTDVGTTSYRPPELLFGNKKYGEALDLWAAGCVVAEAASLNGRSLFDSGDLGSELALIQSIFKGLGTPDLSIWPEAETFPDWGKMTFREFPSKQWAQLLPEAPSEARDLVSQLVRYQSTERLSAAEALTHPYFAKALLNDDIMSNAPRAII